MITVFIYLELPFQKAFHFDLRLETTGSEALQRFLNNGRHRFVPHQYLSMITRLFVVPLRINAYTPPSRGSVAFSGATASGV